MLNYLWLGLISFGIIIGIINGNIDTVTNATVNSCENAIKFIISITGIMCFWTGIMEIARKSGMISTFSNLLKPVMRFLFPDNVHNEQAMGAVMMNLSANFLGLGNAATPFGIEAMKELQKDNKNKDSLSDSMCMFLVLNTACMQMVPATLIAVRSAVGSENPTGIMLSVWIVSLISLVVGVIAAKFLRKLC